MRAGTNRKFHKNMQYERSARQLAVLSMSFLSLIGPLAIVAIAAFMIFGHSSHGGHASGILAASMMPLGAIRELNEKRQKAVADGQALIPKTGEKWSPEARQKFDGFMTEADALKVQIDEALADAEREARASTAAGHKLTLPEDPIGNGTKDRAALVKQYRAALVRHGSKALEILKPESRAEIEGMQARYMDAAKEYLLKDLQGMSAENRQIFLGQTPEYRDMGIGTNTSGGYFVPQGYVYDIEQAMKWYGSMLDAAQVFDTASGQNLPYPTDNDTNSMGEIVGENQQVTTGDISIGQISFGAFKFSTKMVKVSMELLQDSAFSLDSYIKDKFATRLGRILNNKTTVGAGTTEPKGLVTAVVANNGAASATPSIGTPLIATGSAGNTGGAENGTNTFGSSDLINLEHTVDPAYRRGSAYMMNDNSLRYVKTLLDKYGRPLWKPGLASGDPDTINSYSYFINQDMASLATGNVTVLFGQLKKYLIRRVKELSILRLNERYAEFGQVAFLGFARYDGNLLDAGTKPVSYLKQA